MEAFSGSGSVLVSSLLEAADKEEGGNEVNLYREPTEKDWSSFFFFGLDKDPFSQ